MTGNADPDPPRSRFHKINSGNFRRRDREGGGGYNPQFITPEASILNSSISKPAIQKRGMDRVLAA